MVDQKRKIEIFSAGFPCCEEVITEIRKTASQSCDVIVLDMKEPDIARRAKDLGVRSVPAVAIDGRLADCCSGRGLDVDTLRAAGLGVPLS